MLSFYLEVLVDLRTPVVASGNIQVYIIIQVPGFLSKWHVYQPLRPANTPWASNLSDMQQKKRNGCAAYVTAQPNKSGAERIYHANGDIKLIHFQQSLKMSRVDPFVFSEWVRSHCCGALLRSKQLKLCEWSPGVVNGTPCVSSAWTGISIIHC